VSQDVYDYAPFASSNNELVSVNNPAAGDWFILLYGYSAYSGVSVLADYVPALAPTATPVLSRPTGNYTSLVSVGFSCSTVGATIRYTTDGSEPTASSAPYTDPILVTTTMNQGPGV